MEDHWKSFATKTKTTTKRMLLVLVVALLRIADRVSSQGGESRDYCEADTFSALCPKNYIIFMTSALYGRMKVGSCVKKDLGHIGCYSDVMRQADNRCSGKRSCQVRIPDSEFDLTRPCHEELKTYLEASYRCIQVEVPKEGSCQNGVDHPFIVHIGSGMGHISSNLYSSSKCSSETWPIRIQAFPGQRINITIFDFRHSSFASTGSDVSRFQPQQQQQPHWLPGRIRRSDVSSTITTALSITGTITTSRQSFQMPGMTTLPYHAPIWPRNQLRIKRNVDSQKHSIKSSSSSSSGHGEADCSFHVVIQDRHAARRLRVCPSQLRQRSVYVSSNHSVEVFFKKEQQQQNNGQENNVDDVDRFLVRYEVLGCEDLKLSDEMWRNKVGDAIEVGCKDSEHKWSLRCIGNKWDGLLGNCSKAALFGISAISDTDLNSLPHGMAIAVVLCVALLMGLTVLIIGALGLLLRRFHKKTTRHPSTVYGVHGKQGSGSATPSQRMLPGSSNNVMLNSQEFFDYADQRKQQQHHHHQHQQQQQQQQQPLQRCVGCNAALADYYATLSHRRCIIPQCDDPYPVATNTDSGTVLSNVLIQGASEDNDLIDGVPPIPGKPYNGFDPSDQADDYTKYPGQGKLQYAREGDYQCTMAGGVCASKASLEGPGLSTPAVWKQQKKPNYCPVLDDKTFSRLENLHGCT